MKWYTPYNRGTRWAGGSIYSGPAPQPTKRWHKVVLDIVTVLLIIGALAWFVIATT